MLKSETEKVLKQLQSEAYQRTIKKLPFFYMSRPDVVMPWDDRLRALVDHVRPGAWDKERYTSARLLAITKHRHGFAATVHLVGKSSFFTSYEEVVSDGAPAYAMRLAIDDHPFMRGHHLDRFEAPDIDAAWEGLLEIYVGPHPAHMKVPKMGADMDNFDRFARSTSSGGTRQAHQIIGHMVKQVTVVR